MTFHLGKGSLEEPAMLFDNSWGIHIDDLDRFVISHDRGQGRYEWVMLQPDTINGKGVLKLLGARYVQFEGEIDGAPCLIEVDDKTQGKKYSFGINGNRFIMRNITERDNVEVIPMDAGNLAIEFKNGKLYIMGLEVCTQDV